MNMNVNTNTMNFDEDDEGDDDKTWCNGHLVNGINIQWTANEMKFVRNFNCDYFLE